MIEKLVKAVSILLETLETVVATLAKMHSTEKRLLCLYANLESRVAELEKK